MFMQILWTQFKWTRTMLAVFAVVTFTVPALAWRLGDMASYGGASPLAVMNGFGLVGPILMVASLLLGLLVVAHVWNLDAATRHVYALSLPLPWNRYVAMRFGAGALSLAVPALALWLGSLVALALIELPATLRAYPGTLAIRFLLGALVAYSLSFLLQYTAGRRAALVLLTILLGGLGITFVASALGFNGILSTLARTLIEWPGPFAVFAADWKLVDV